MESSDGSPNGAICACLRRKQQIISRDRSRRSAPCCDGGGRLAVTVGDGCPHAGLPGTGRPPAWTVRVPAGPASSRVAPPCGVRSRRFLRGQRPHRFPPQVRVHGGVPPARGMGRRRGAPRAGRGPGRRHVRHRAGTGRGACSSTRTTRASAPPSSPATRSTRATAWHGAQSIACVDGYNTSQANPSLRTVALRQCSQDVRVRVPGPSRAIRVCVRQRADHGVRA